MGQRIEGRSLRADLRELLPWVAMTVVVWGGVVGFRHHSAPIEPQAPAWEHSYLELTQPQQLRYRLIREGLLEAENVRSRTGQWPSPESLAADGIPPFEANDLRWSMRRHGIYVNYVGIPTGAAEPRWLIVFIEPEAVAFEAKAPPPPVDEEHHTLPDGTALHVTVWSSPNEGPVPSEVLAFPVSEGWVRRVGR
jgi:hypothetical protein